MFRKYYKVIKDSLFDIIETIIDILFEIIED